MLGQNDPEGGPEESKESKVPTKSMGKLVRVMTVVAYLSSVSMAGILLSIYYLCIWKSPSLSDLEAKVSHQQGEPYNYQLGYMNNDSTLFNITGGGSTTVNDNNVQLPPSSVTYTDDHESSDVIDTAVTEPTTPFDSSVNYNATTEAIDSSNKTRSVTSSLAI